MDGPNSTRVRTTTAVRHTYHKVNKKAEGKQVKLQSAGEREQKQSGGSLAAVAEDLLARTAL